MRKTFVRGFGNALRFSGRETRSAFWPYVCVIVVLYMIVLLIAVPASALAGGGMDHVFKMNLVLLAMIVALLAAAVSRRLHDSGLKHTLLRPD